MTYVRFPKTVRGTNLDRLRSAGTRRSLWLCAMICAARLVAADAPDALEIVQESAGEWVKLRAETARLEHEWQLEKGLLESTVAGLQERAATLETERDLLKAKTAGEREEQSSLQGKARATEEEQRLLAVRLKSMSEQLIATRPLLPPRLSDALEMSFRTLVKPELSLSERIQTTTTVLNRCAQFDHMISYGEEVLTLDPAEGAKSLEVIYWGLSHGYVLDEPSGKAWLGSPQSDGWRWEARPEAVQAVARLIATYRDKADPDFVIVPATLRHGSVEGVTP